MKDESVVLSMAKGDDTEQLEVESLLLAIGVVPNLEGAISEDLKLELDRGYLKVDENYQTSIPGIYGAGDIVGPPWLAHVATYRAIQALMVCLIILNPFQLMPSQVAHIASRRLPALD